MVSYKGAGTLTMSGPWVQVGYTNAHHQRVIVRARRRDYPANCFVVWCSQCWHYYVADEIEIVTRRCPNHDLGAPALSADHRDAEWMTGSPVLSANKRLVV
jgi:hypothetical protein